MKKDRLTQKKVEEHLQEHERREQLEHLMHIEPSVRHETDGYTFALAGNPNAGKTTLFNALTGAKQYVGNWPGVTVEKKIGLIRGREEHIHLVDLPGIYSLSPYSVEEIVTRKYLIEEKPDLIVNIVDATNLERNLYLTTQLQELGVPMVIALNMIDAVRRRGDSIDCALLEAELGMPVVPISASKGEGVDTVVERALALLRAKTAPPVPRIYSKDLESAIAEIAALIGAKADAIGMNRRFAAVKLFEGDEMTVRSLGMTPQDEMDVGALVEMAEHRADIDHETVVADQRYRYICALTERAVQRAHEPGYETLSDRLDRVLTHRVFAIPIFLLIMVLVFFITFGPIGSFLQDGLESLLSVQLAGAAERGLTAIGGEGWWVTGLVVEGIIGGLGTVISFFPQILLLFLFLSLLEDSGYMARAAFIMDRALRKIGLSGKAFVPMLMGFGCSVPAILAARTLENEKDRRMTVIITPFMSCTARMPVYAMFIAAFFEKSAALVISCIYFGGILVAVLSGLLLKNTVLRGEPAPFVMELPPYRLPTLGSLYRHLYERVKDFVVRAGTVLLGAAVVIWFLKSFDGSFHMVDDASQSILADIGRFLAPLFAPLGFGNWQSAVSLISGFMAKESIISTMGVLLAGGDVASLTGALHSMFTPLTAISFLTFVLLYTPCIAAVSATAREMGSARWTAFAIIYQTVVAWVVSFAVYHVGGMLLRGAAGAVELAVVAVCVAAVVAMLAVWLRRRRKGRCAGGCGCSGCR